MDRGTSTKIDRCGAPIKTNYPEWKSAWAVVELFSAARSMAPAYCGIGLWPDAISLEVTCNKPWFRSQRSEWPLAARTHPATGRRDPPADDRLCAGSGAALRRAGLVDQLRLALHE